MMLDIFPITVNLNVLHFGATTIVLIILLVHAASKWDVRKRKADEAMGRTWGFQGFVNGEGRFVSRVRESQKSDPKRPRS